jgi:hypothetical protein
MTRVLCLDLLHAEVILFHTETISDNQKLNEKEGKKKKTEKKAIDNEPG